MARPPRPSVPLAAAVALAAALLAVVTPSPPAGAAAGDGTVLAFGPAPFLGSPPSSPGSPVVAVAGTPSGQGYWLAGSDGAVSAFGDAVAEPPAPVRHPVVGVAAAPLPGGRTGYWLVAADGGVFAFGGAPFLGSTGDLRLNHPVVGMAGAPSGRGYWLVARDGGVFAFGDAPFLGSTGALRLNRPVVGTAATPSGRGYWLVAADGGVFAFGDAPFLGSTGALRLSRPVVGMATTPSGRGYWLVAEDGGVFAFGDAVFHGAGVGAVAPGKRVVGVAAGSGRAAGGYWLAAGLPPVAPGAVGPGVAGLQRRLLDLGFWGPVDGRYGALTVQQVYAFQKANGLPRDGRLSPAEVALLERAGRVQPRTRTGYVVEVDKARQLLIVARDGRAEWVFNTSTGNNRRYGRGKVAVTPEGRFAIYREINGMRVSELGQLFRPRYFTGGYAIHGSPSIPPYPASHGCVRVSNAAINFIWANNVMPLGTPVLVYS